MTVRYLTRYARLSAGRSLRRKVTEFPTYLRGMWELEPGRGVTREGLRRVSLRLRGKAPGRGAQT